MQKITQEQIATDDQERFYQEAAITAQCIRFRYPDDMTTEKVNDRKSTD